MEYNNLNYFIFVSKEKELLLELSATAEQTRMKKTLANKIQLHKVE